MDVALTPPQARALLWHAVDGAPPAEMDGHALGALRRGADRLAAAVDHLPQPPVLLTIDTLGDRLLDVRDPAFAALVHDRARDLLAVTRLWWSAQALPRLADRERLLDVARVDRAGWMVEVVEALDEAGMRWRASGVGERPRARNRPQR